MGSFGIYQHVDGYVGFRVFGFNAGTFHLLGRCTLHVLMSLQISKRPVVLCCFSGTLSGCLTTSFRGRTVFNGPVLNRSTKMLSGMTSSSQPPKKSLLSIL